MINYEFITDYYEDFRFKEAAELAYPAMDG
jgi:hypothetical protein